MSSRNKSLQRKVIEPFKQALPLLMVGGMDEVET
jgi:hypothetical protein